MNATLIAAAIGVGGTVIVGLAGFWANVRSTNKLAGLTEQGQLTDRYSKAIEQLGSDKLDVRIGGIYALERIARDSPRDHPTIMEVLAAFIREHSREQWPPAEPGAESPERSPRSDVQAALTVMGRRDAPRDTRPIDLSDADLAGAKLPRHAGLAKAKFMRAVLIGVDLTEQDLSGADLAGADLTKAKLIGAKLSPADLTKAERADAKHTDARPIAANLTGADLTGADLTEADLTDADLTKAKLIDANLTGAFLGGAVFTGAFLGGAVLTGAHLTGADLGGADLRDVRWPSDTSVPSGWQRDTDSGRLKRAAGDSGDMAAEDVGDAGS
jgi:uncharacterized protein YjbI with pentapeptide repeats